MAKLQYHFKDLRASFGCSDYKIRQLVKSGIIPEPHRPEGQLCFWTLTQIEAARKRFDERYNQPAVIAAGAPNKPKIRPFNARQIARIQGREFIR